MGAGNGAPVRETLKEIAGFAVKQPDHIILPDTGAELLRRELALGFAACGCGVGRVDPAALDGPDGQAVLEAARGSGPALFFSVNFQGLLPLRERLTMLDRAGVRAAVWLVDNPWNILSGVGHPLWKSLPVFVTDAAFVGPLRGHGARRVHHLPLAACFELFSANALRDQNFPPPADPAPLCFAGRAAFPGKGRFFAGASLPSELENNVPALLAQGERPDLFWWERQLGLAGAAFWPGKKARVPALGAEESNALWRAMCLGQAARAGSALAAPGAPGLDLYGDGPWQDRLPPATRLLPPVDYYARLPGIYASARYSLCLTSLQLPQGLNQRHFDVWAAGGFAVSDATPGLDIFPQDLVRPVTFRKPGDLPALIRGLEKSGGRAALQNQWRDCLKADHTYTRRAAAVLEALAAGE